ncbi:glycosyltransferase family 4 protein [Marinifilum fragile]|uniref:glycosyltransferase family 4 protein n=1 Tax=Marinifilum fragile TaxID=570161 RepID=UPI002AA61250|nr:glycosyltransferase family 4 protein [Marinifilum fragile]
MSKIVWIVNKHSKPPKYESHFRYIKYAQYLKEQGYCVKIFASSFMHNSDKNLLNPKEDWKEVSYDDLDYVLVNTCEYKGNGIKRMYSLYQFTQKVIRLMPKFQQPDIIIHTTNTPFTHKLGAFAKKKGIRYIAEVLDLWPESFVSFGLIKKGNPLMKLAYGLEKKLYSNADNVVFSMEGGKEYIIEKEWDLQTNDGPVDLRKVIYINNSVDLEDFNQLKLRYDFEPEESFNKKNFYVLYLGSISLANNVQALVEAAEILQDKKDIKFLIYGDGSYRDTLEKYCDERELTNVILKEKRIDYKYVPSLLSKSSLNILNFQQSDIERYGGCQGKLFNYIASAKPICCNVEMGYCLINKHNLGIAKNFKSAREYADAILSLYDLEADEYKKMCERVKSVSEEYDFRKQSQKLMNLI